MNEEKLNDLDRKVYVHSEKIKELEEFKDDHEEKHETMNVQHYLNTEKIKIIEKALLSVLGIVVTYFLTQLLNIIK